ncbi:hypothetical protein GGTG_14179 [Gaeumannomyces tritici R3-111a-1]|uniref:Uncharacterized protein n=1 Tax=Gaeumannomyces tritici (strain R3-111a-1) TaxID=644352 RepID=J3PKV7_GAET3|nr:hypothetical protein GGTG_14179 [Gaeumannomyces tritici R3-111a-1]EJT68245.1 hypothetical protein GGTG_14179 [Gaeumannomyces tritici R3-111a-1]
MVRKAEKSSPMPSLVERSLTWGVSSTCRWEPALAWGHRDVLGRSELGSTA